MAFHAPAMTDVAAIASIPSALQSAKGAIHRSGKALDQDANVVARSQGLPSQDENSQDALSRDVIGAMIDSKQQVLYTQAAAKLISASDEITKSLLDITA
jgi:hypothetical protein